MTTPPVTSGRADTAMTDPRIALADRLAYEAMACKAGPRASQMRFTSEELEILQAALRAIQPEELPDPKNVPASAHAGWDENGRRKFHPPYDKIAHILNAQSETWMREQTIEECARICDAAAKMHKHSRSGVVDQQWFEIKAEEAFQLSKSIRALSASKPGAVASAPVHPAPGVDAAAPVRGRTG